MAVSIGSKSFSEQCGGVMPVPTPAIVAGFDAAIIAATRKMGATAPNPPVGCALLDRDGHILTLAAHERAGEAHAERRALDAAMSSGVLGRVYSAIVTLEPCNHIGRTPPCAQALLNSPVQEVWIGVADPNPNARGGAATLQGAVNGPAVFWAGEIPLLAQQHAQCESLIAPFRKVQREGKCFITVKQALNDRGSMIPPEGQTTFTSESSLILAHRLRRATDAIITGSGTIMHDHPRLTVRHVPDHPSRAPRILVVCDRRNRVTDDTERDYAARAFETWVVGDIASLPRRLAQSGALWAMVEAGPELLSSIEESDFWDEWLTIRTRQGQADIIDIQARGSSPTALLSLLRDPPQSSLTADQEA